MSYDFGLFNTIDDSVDTLNKVTDKSIKRWGYPVEEIRQGISAIVHEMEWSGDDQTFGQVIRDDWGRFECDLDVKDCFIVVRTSFHCDYRNFVIAIAKTLKLSAFDTQTGERIYNPFNGTQIPGNGQPPGFPMNFGASSPAK